MMPKDKCIARGHHGETRLGPRVVLDGCVNEDIICIDCDNVIGVRSTNTETDKPGPNPRLQRRARR